MHFEDHLEDFVKEFKGNWEKFESFGWSYWRSGIEDPENWGIFYTHNRDSGLLDQSNAEAIEKEMELFIENGTAHHESHNHWACGWINGYSVRVVDENGNITDAARKICELKMAMEEYPVLDESDYSEREYNETINNISNNAYRFVSQEILDNDDIDWVGDLFTWFWDNDQSEVESYDDHGGYPSDKGYKKALKKLGYLASDYDDDQD